MAVSVVPGSVKINLYEYPQAKPPEAPLVGIPLGPQAPAPVLAGFLSTQISLGGEVQLTGDPDEIMACSLGFIQVEWVETFWCYYRGKTNSDGSLLVQLGRPPARPQQACRDVLDPLKSTIWYSVDDVGQPSSADKMPVVLGAGIDDSPSASALLGQLNETTGQTNLLHEVQIERFFCAVLTLLTGDGDYVHLASRYWNVRWQAIFQASDFDRPFSAPWKITPVKGGNGSAVSATILGKPTDHRFTGALTFPSAPICNTLIKNARNSVDNFLLDGTPNPQFDRRTRRESAVWSNFDVRK